MARRSPRHEYTDAARAVLAARGWRDDVRGDGTEPLVGPGASFDAWDDGTDEFACVDMDVWAAVPGVVEDELAYLVGEYAWASGGPRSLVTARLLAGEADARCWDEAAVIDRDDEGLAPALVALTVPGAPDGWRSAVLAEARRLEVGCGHADVSRSLTGRQGVMWGGWSAVAALGGLVGVPDIDVVGWAVDGGLAAAALARNPECPESLLAVFAVSESVVVRLSVAANAGAPDHVRVLAALGAGQ